MAQKSTIKPLSPEEQQLTDQIKAALASAKSNCKSVKIELGCGNSVKVFPDGRVVQQ